MKSIEEILAVPKYRSIQEQVRLGRQIIEHLTRHIKNEDIDAIRVMIHESLYRPGLHSRLKPIGVYLADQISVCNSAVIIATITSAVENEINVSDPAAYHRRYNPGLQILTQGTKNSPRAAQTVVIMLGDTAWNPEAYDAIFQISKYLQDNTDRPEFRLQVTY